MQKTQQLFLQTASVFFNVTYYLAATKKEPGVNLTAVYVHLR